jgi:uridine kinase
MAQAPRPVGYKLGGCLCPFGAVGFLSLGPLARFAEHVSAELAEGMWSKLAPMKESSSSETRVPVVVGVAGGTGAGKTTISNAILDYVGRESIAYIQHDSYYRDLSHLPLEQRRLANFDHPDALEDSLLLAHLDQLLRLQPVEVPTYDFRTYTRLPQTLRQEPKAVILLEGILLFANPDLRNLMDIKIYVDADADIRFIRRLQRDVQERGRSVASVVEQYMRTVRPMHLEFVEPSKRYADVIVPATTRNVVALEMICARIGVLLSEASHRGSAPHGVAP